MNVIWYFIHFIRFFNQIWIPTVFLPLSIHLIFIFFWIGLLFSISCHADLWLALLCWLATWLIQWALSPLWVCPSPRPQFRDGSNGAFPGQVQAAWSRSQHARHPKPVMALQMWGWAHSNGTVTEWMVYQTDPSITVSASSPHQPPMPQHMCAPPPLPVSSRVTNMSGHRWREMITQTNSRANRFNRLINPPPRWINPMTGFVHDNLMTLWCFSF